MAVIQRQQNRPQSTTISALDPRHTSQVPAPRSTPHFIASPAGGSFPESGSGFLTTLSERGGQQNKGCLQVGWTETAGQGSPSLVRQGITQQNLSPGHVHQALPGFVDGQFTLSGECLYPALLIPQAQPAKPHPPLPNQWPLPWNGHQLPLCPSSGWMVGTCDHGTQRWIHLSCKQRSCPVCGRQRRRKMAYRISSGVRILAGPDGAAWFVGTWPRTVSKKQAVSTQGKFIRWLRKELGSELQYAATWEITRQGRLHLNLILAPWSYIPQKLLSQKWQRFGGGRVVWIQHVSPAIGAEAAKTNQAIGNYLSKWEQMVLTGRGVCYSKGWPKLADNPLQPRQGKISWTWENPLGPNARMHWYEREMGYWYLVSPDEYTSVLGEPCTCFSRGPPIHAPLQESTERR